MSTPETKMFKILMVGLFEDVFEFDSDSCSSKEQAESIAETEFSDYGIKNILKDEVSAFTHYPQVKVTLHTNKVGDTYYEAEARGVFNFIFTGEFDSRESAIETCTNAFNERFRVFHSVDPNDFFPFFEVNAIDQTDSHS
jgi:hypothetical protein